MNYDVVIVGNGILGCAIAYLLSQEVPELKIAIIGDPKREGSASMAAGAMLNVFSEVDENTLCNDIAKERFVYAIQSTSLWKEWAIRLAKDSGMPVDYKLGTKIVVRNDSDQEKMDLIVKALNEFNEPYTYPNPGSLGMTHAVSFNGLEYNHTPQHKEITIPGEGWVIPSQLFAAFDKYLHKSSVHTEGDKVSIINTEEKTVFTQNYQKTFTYGKLILAAGAYTGELLKNLGVETPRMFYGVGNAFVAHGNFKQEQVVRTPVRTGTCGIVLVPQNGHMYVGASSWVTKNPEYYPRFSSIYNISQEALLMNSDLLESKISKFLVGHRPITEDGMPLIGELDSIEDIYVVTGTRRDGLHMSPLLAKDTINRLLGYSPIVSETFAPERAPLKTLSLMSAIKQTAKIRRSPFGMLEKEMEAVEKIYEDKKLDRGVLPELLDII